MGLNPNHKAESCKLCETSWNPNANPSLAFRSGAPSQTHRSMLVKERLEKPDGSGGPPEGWVCKLKRGMGTQEVSAQNLALFQNFWVLGPSLQAFCLFENQTWKLLIWWFILQNSAPGALIPPLSFLVCRISHSETRDFATEVSCNFLQLILAKKGFDKLVQRNIKKQIFFSPTLMFLFSPHVFIPLNLLLSQFWI